MLRPLGMIDTRVIRGHLSGRLYLPQLVGGVSWKLDASAASLLI
jgi:hypothetical protein